MKKSLFILFIFCSLFSKGQNPLVKMWDKRFGGSSYDEITIMFQTLDSGYILGGSSLSGISGDKTQGSWGGLWGDYWIVKTDSLGNKQWDKDFGGSDDDLLLSIQQTSDGGYILGGWSDSYASGDKTQSTQDTSTIRGDYWIVKIDSAGNKQWDKDFGGTYYDYLNYVEQTLDGGYILGGRSGSNAGGDKTQNLKGYEDYWIIKLDSTGNKQWDKDFGGTNIQSLYCVHQTSDRGYILGGLSASNAGGDKTQALWGGNDYWIVKIDSLGNMLWDKDFGGTDNDILYSIAQTPDGGYILGGFSGSNAGGDKTQNLIGISDYWIIKIDSLGNKEWDRDFGGTDQEEFYSIELTSDNGFLISGDSYSMISGDKTESNLGQEQTWVVKTDSLGNKQWDKTIYTSGHDERGLAIQTCEGCYVFANSTFSGLGGYKTQLSQGASDYWIVKFCDSTFLPPTATAFTDSLLCPGTCTNFTNLSFSATSYQWSFSGATPPSSTDVNPQNICYATPGSYDVQLIATNANGSDTLLLTNYITVFPAPPPQSITQNGDTLFAIAGSASYQWYFNGNFINGATDYFYVAPASGDYNVVATDVNGCEVEAAVFNVVASVDEIGDQEILIFPNPVGDRFTIHDARFTMRTANEISIYNVMGEKMEIEIPISSIGIQSTEINVQSLTPGLYYLEITTKEKTFRTKFVKQ